MKSVTLGAAAASLAAIAAATAFAQPRQAGGGTATYWMSAETLSGLAAMSQNGRPDMAAMMSGRGPSHLRNLTLQLGSPRRPAGPPSAEHLPPAALGAGASLPLVTPQGVAAAPPTRPPGMGQGEGARGRLLIYWGCGERARPGQPFEIDLARLSQGQMPPAMATLQYRPMTPPSASTSTTYGEWPNARSRVTVPAAGSLVGEHVVRGNYSPEIRFGLAPGQDFLPPIVLTSNSRAASGAVPLAWQPIAPARGWFVMASGAREDGTIVLWSSSEVQFSQMGAFDYLAPDEVARLIQQRVVLPPQTTQCTVPAEVAGSVQAASLMLTAFGPEANFSHPARPAQAPRGWAPESVVKLRTRAMHVGMLGMNLEEMMGGGRGEEAQPPQRRRRSLRDRLRDRIRGQ
jgi:hypothetical protein